MLAARNNLETLISFCTTEIIFLCSFSAKEPKLFTNFFIFFSSEKRSKSSRLVSFHAFEINSLIGGFRSTLVKQANSFQSVPSSIPIESGQGIPLNHSFNFSCIQLRIGEEERIWRSLFDCKKFKKLITQH